MSRVTPLSQLARFLAAKVKSRCSWFVERKKEVEHVRNVMAHAQKPDLVFQRNGRVHLNRRGCQFSRLLAAEECGSADSDCIDRVPTYSARLLATHSIRIFPLHFPSCASPCAMRFRTRYSKLWPINSATVERTHRPSLVCFSCKTSRMFRNTTRRHIGRESKLFTDG